MSNDGGTAFPAKKQVYQMGYATNEYEPTEGMSLRDYFAAKALQGLIAHPASENYSPPLIARYAYEQADAMLKARGE